jgi:uncharacterized repeat protein (TIGR04076 family)
MFQVKATVVGFQGNTDVYPCHFKSRVGDEVVFDGESFHGLFCPAVWAVVVPKMMALHATGPRYLEPASCYPFWYAANTAPDPAQVAYDGLGFRNVLETIVPPAHDMATLQPPGSFHWPPSERPGLATDPVVICPDTRTSMVIRLEAFDLSEKGFDTPYFRRQMAILAKLQKHGPAPADQILGLFTKEESEGIYPPLSPVMVAMLTEELALLGYLEAEGADGRRVAAGLVGITARGAEKLAAFKAALPPEHREAFAEYT